MATRPVAAKAPRRSRSRRLKIMDMIDSLAGTVGRFRPILASGAAAASHEAVTRHTFTSSPAERGADRSLCRPHPQQHGLNRSLGDRELGAVACAQHHVGVRSAMLVEERIAADRDLRIGLGDLAERRPDVALATIGAY